MPQNYRFQLLIPPQAHTNAPFGDHRVNQQLYDQSLDSMQRLRARVYLKDGAIQPWEIDEDGRFAMRGDEQSWHLLLKDGQGAAIGCARYLVHANTVAPESLKLLQSSMAQHRDWGPRVRLGVESELRRAREHGLSYVEIGGWALSEEWRGTRAALEILVASYALAPLWGGCLASCTATVRHGSASILRRMGGSSFEVGGEKLPPYGDPSYGCTMELLRFDSRAPAQRFVPLIDEIRATIATAQVIRRTSEASWGLRAAEAAVGQSLLPRMAPAYG